MRHVIPSLPSRAQIAIWFKHTGDDITFFVVDIRDFVRVFYYYLNRKLRTFGKNFEEQKDTIVSFLVAKRGTYQRPFMHTSVAMLIIAGIIGGPLIGQSYSSVSEELNDFTPSSAIITSLDAEELSTITQISEKPRDRVITHTVVDGDTLSNIAEKYGVSVDSIRWANDNFKGDKLKMGQELQIPPVTGLVIKVKRGETVYSIAKRYQIDAQNIVNWPFNEFADLDTFALVAGQTLIVPNGVPPAQQPTYRPALVPQTIAGGAGRFAWPTQGTITQYPVSYHMALDIANNAAPPIGAAEAGTVAYVEYGRYGYGHHVIVDHGDGFQTLYAHLSDIYVNVGDSVARGSVIGRMGSSGRSTGIHLHFEVRRGGVIVNPLSYLQ